MYRVSRSGTLFSLWVHAEGGWWACVGLVGRGVVVFFFLFLHLTSRRERERASPNRFPFASPSVLQQRLS